MSFLKSQHPLAVEEGGPLQFIHLGIDALLQLALEAAGDISADARVIHGQTFIGPDNDGDVLSLESGVRRRNISSPTTFEATTPTASQPAHVNAISGTSKIKARTKNSPAPRPIKTHIPAPRLDPGKSVTNAIRQSREDE